MYLGSSKAIASLGADKNIATPKKFKLYFTIRSIIKERLKMKNSHYIKTGLASFAAYAVVAIASVNTFGMAHASDYPAAPIAAAQTITAASTTSGDFVQKSKTLKGSWQVLEVNGQTVIRFDDNFKAKKGPDLKVFLSPQSLEQVNGKSATNGSVLLGKLQNTKGTQDYVLPAGINLAAFNSVLVHCEAYSVLWGGGAL